MRPAEVGPAIVKAADDYVRELHRQFADRPGQTDGRKGATLAELATRACVGRKTARDLVPKLKSRGQLLQVGERRVEYRNRPVAEYAPAKVLSLEDVQEMAGPAVLGNCLQNWTR